MAAVTALGFQRQHRPVTHTTVQVRHSTHTVQCQQYFTMNKRIVYEQEMMCQHAFCL